MSHSSRRIGTLGAAILAFALPVVASAQGPNADFRPERDLGIDQNLGKSVPLDAQFTDETGAPRTLGSVLKGRPVLVVPFPLRRTAGCGVAIEGLGKTLFRSANPNVRKLIKKEGPNKLVLGQTFDLVFLSIDPRDKPEDAAKTKADFLKALNDETLPVTCLLGSKDETKRVTDALGFRFYYNASTGALWDPTGAVLLTPQGQISSYTLGNDFQTVELERDLETAAAGRIGEKANAPASPFACAQLATSVLDRRGKIEGVITGFALLTLATVVYWIGSMLRTERRQTAEVNRQSSIVNP